MKGGFRKNRLNVGEFELLAKLLKLLFVREGSGNDRHAQGDRLVGGFSPTFSQVFHIDRGNRQNRSRIGFVFIFKHAADRGGIVGSHAAAHTHATGHARHAATHTHTAGHAATCAHATRHTATATTCAGACRATGTRARGSGSPFDKHKDLGKIVVECGSPEGDSGKIDLDLDRLKDLGHPSFDFRRILGDEERFPSHIRQGVDGLDRIIGHWVDANVFGERGNISRRSHIGGIRFCCRKSVFNPCVLFFELFLVA